MTPDELCTLLGEPESATLEFKQEFYRLDDPDQQVKEEHREEFIKDVLALANGNAATAGQTAYLIIGAGDTLRADGTRELFDITSPLPDRRTLRSRVNAACAPHLDTLIPDAVTVDGKRLIVITIPFSPHLHETTRRLKTRGQTYTEHIVLYREDAEVRVANALQREVIQILKRRRYADQFNAPPRLLGAMVGAMIGGAMAEQQSRRPLTGGRGTRTIAGGLVGGLVGGSLGASYRDLRRFWFDMSLEPLPRRIALVTLLVVFVLASQPPLRWLLRLVGNQLARTTSSTELPMS